MRSKPKTRRFFAKKRFWGVLFLGLVGFGFLFALTQRPLRIMMQTAPNAPKGLSASPALQATSVTDWRAQTREIKADLESHIYGKVPIDLKLTELSRTTLPNTYFDGSAKIDVFMMRLTNPVAETFRDFSVVIARPANKTSNIPLILSQNFCPNHAVILAPGIPKPKVNGFDCSGDGFASKIFGYFFGRYISTPPLEDILAQGYAYGAIYATEFVPDSKVSGRNVLDAFFANYSESSRPGALAAWGAQFSLVSDFFKSDPLYSKSILYGHSRFGKTALIAAAFNPNIDSVIAHQSGTGGASLSRNKPGETISDIVNGYPFWFGDKYSDFSEDQSALPVDQHGLLALIAPRPILLGNARRDVWSDPNGAFRAAQGASPIYELLGSDGLTAQKLNQFKPEDNLSFWIRPGTHGVGKEDWEAFLNFLNVHFKP